MGFVQNIIGFVKKIKFNKLFFIFYYGLLHKYKVIICNAHCYLRKIITSFSNNKEDLCRLLFIIREDQLVAIYSNVGGRFIILDYDLIFTDSPEFPDDFEELDCCSFPLHELYCNAQTMESNHSEIQLELAARLRNLGF